MVKLPSRPTILTASLAGILTALPVQAADTTGNPPAEVTESSNIEALTVTGKRSADQKGADDVFYKNVANAYLGKEYLERYQTDAAGDVLKGLNGVYNMNTRTAGSAITPSIRGISGKGRIPVTIDGTEQTVDVWMNQFGISDRNYVDPALFRSIAVEKSPAMTRGVKSGVGGSVTVSTIEADDIVPEGETWGIQIKGSLTSGKADRRGGLRKFLGRDYRTIDEDGLYAVGTDNQVKSSDNMPSPYYVAQFVGKNVDPKEQGGGLGKFANDKSGMIAAAFKTRLSDGLIAYTRRNKGNYYAGKRGADGYRNNPVYDESELMAADYQNTSATMIPNMAWLYRPGWEVFNSNLSGNSLLLKNNWHLPANQKISLTHMRNRIEFGENNPWWTDYMMQWARAFNRKSTGTYNILPYQSTDSSITTRSYKLGYSWKPENSRWIDLQANVWRVKTNSTRYQSGGPDFIVHERDLDYDYWRVCSIAPEYKMFELLTGDPRQNLTCAQLQAQGYVPKTRPQPAPAEGRGFALRSGTEQTTRTTRSGADISNRFRLTDKLGMTVSANVQHEKLDEKSEVFNEELSFFNITGQLTFGTAVVGPRSGRRHEWGSGIAFDWQPTNRLNIQAGVRYDRFWAYDDETARQRKERKNPYYALDQRGTGESVVTGVYIPYYELVTDEAQLREMKRLAALPPMNDQEYERYKTDVKKFYDKYGGVPLNDYRNEYKFGPAVNIFFNPATGSGWDDSKTVSYILKHIYSPYYNGQFQKPAAAFHKGMFDETVTNPQGKKGVYYKYLTQATQSHGDNYNEARKHADPAIFHIPYYPEFYNFDEIQTLINRPNQVFSETRKMSVDEVWQPPKYLRGHAWSPMIAASYDLTDNNRLFLRWAQATRFPSLYETSSVNTSITNAYNPYFDLKPERSTNWEIGYAFNFAPHIKKLRAGDIRLTYYNNTIKNAIDFVSDKHLAQYDKKQTAGIELQSRIDSGRWFAAFAANYRLRNRTCDKNTAWNYDIYNNRIPECIDGGFGATRFYQGIQPKYSLNLDAGTRRFGEKLELGMRATYHSKVSTKQQDELAAQGLARILNATGRPFHWRAALVFDMYGRYQISKNFGLNFGITNLTNRYYLDPMSNVPVPAPGRAVTFGFTGKF